MARKPRIHLPGGLYHVMLRGNGGEAIFCCDEDREHLAALLADGITRFGHRVHAFCWMTNHVHLAIQVATIPLSTIMHNLAFRYTRWMHRHQQRNGHLFQGRYKALLVETDPYVLALVRYIHLNPVRAGLVTDPAAYAWSGHRAYLGHTTIPWLSTDWVLSLLATRQASARRRYGQFVLQGLQEGYREEFHRGPDESRVLGSDTFIEQVLVSTQAPPVTPPPLDEVVTRVCTLYQLTEAQLRARGQARVPAEARAVIAWVAVQGGSASLTAVSQRFGRDVATLSIAVRRLTERAQDSALLKERLVRLGVEADIA